MRKPESQSSPRQAAYDLAHSFADRRSWGDIETDATAKRYYDTAVACMVDLIGEGAHEPFRRGVRAAVQAAVDDLGGLVKRREMMHANPDITAVMVGIARRVATLPMPVAEDSATIVPSREFLTGRVAKMLAPGFPWDEVDDLAQLDDAMKSVWQLASEIVVLVRYA